MSERQHIEGRSPNATGKPAERDTDPTTGWRPVFRALRREFGDSLARIVAGRDPVDRLLGYRRLMRQRYGIELPEPELAEDATDDTTDETQGTAGRRTIDGRR